MVQSESSSGRSDLAGAELVEGDDAVALVREPGVAVAQVVAGQPRPAVDAEQHLVAGAEAVGHDVVAVHGDVDGLVRRAIVHHGLRLPPAWAPECSTFAGCLQAGRGGLMRARLASISRRSRPRGFRRAREMSEAKSSKKKESKAKDRAGAQGRGQERRCRAQGQGEHGKRRQDAVGERQGRRQGRRFGKRQGGRQVRPRVRRRQVGRSLRLFLQRAHARLPQRLGRDLGQRQR